MEKNYTILVWTAGTLEYVLPRLADTGLYKYLYGILTRNNMSYCGLNYIVKDISIFGIDTD